MQLEVGMYVRTRKGKISRIINKYDNSGSLHEKNIVWVLDDTSVLALHSQKVVKASHNIIDLIEVGDYVNGYEVYESDGKLWIERLDDYGNPHFTNIAYLNEISKLKSIVTKEQFESMEYKIGE